KQVPRDDAIIISRPMPEKGQDPSQGFVTHRQPFSEDWWLEVGVTEREGRLVVYRMELYPKDVQSIPSSGLTARDLRDIRLLGAIAATEHRERKLLSLSHFSPGS